MLSVLDIVKATFSAVLLIYSLVVLSRMNFEEETKLSHQAGAPISFVAMILSIMWLARVEGSQAPLVGLAAVDSSLYKDSHPWAYKISSIAHKGDNLDRFLMGRQFMVVILFFIIYMAGRPVDEDVETYTKFSDFMIQSGVALIIVTTILGELYSQVSAANFMLDYCNNRFMLFTTYVCLIVEASGLLHVSYLINYIFSRIKGYKIESNEPPRNSCQKFLFGTRVFFSFGVVSLSFIIIVDLLVEEKTSMWEGVPFYVSTVLFLFLVVIVGMLEGMQIAAFAVARIAPKDREINRWARWSSDLLFFDEEGGGKGLLSSFLIGRELLVATCFIVLARVTTPEIRPGQDNVFHFSDGIQKFLDTGFLGIIVTSVLASISWRLVAAAFPLSFLGNPMSYVLLRLSLFMDGTGICSFALILSEIQSQLFGYDEDEVHIGTPEERAAEGKPDKLGGTGKMGGGAFPATFGRKKKKQIETFTMDDLIQHKADLERQCVEAKTEGERDALERELTFTANAIRERDASAKDMVSETEFDADPDPTGS